MSIFIRAFNPNQIANFYRVLSTAPARCAHWYPDMKPGPYPRTKEEREAAAKKYNLLPEEYEPYPEDTDEACGDYPKLPFESIDSKDPWYPWDNEELRKDFGEPVHKNIINLLPETLSTDPENMSHKEKGLICILLLSSVGLLLHFLSKFKIVTPILEQQFVTPGVTHYTFEQDEEEGRRRRMKKKVVCKEE